MNDLNSGFARLLDKVGLIGHSLCIKAARAFHVMVHVELSNHGVKRGIRMRYFCFFCNRKCTIFRDEKRRTFGLFFEPAINSIQMPPVGRKNVEPSAAWLCATLTDRQFRSFVMSNRS